MVLHIDTDDLERLGLDMRELWVLTALRVLSSHKPWKGTYEDLKTKSQCGSKASAQRIVEVLKQKGLIVATEEGLSYLSQNKTEPSQNETKPSQNETESSQNETESKEKEKNQKKIEKIKDNKHNVSFSACEEKKAASPEDLIFNRLFNMDVLFPGDKPKIPANTGYYKIIVLEYGYMNPKSFVDEFYNYWDGQGWPERGNKLSLMRSWMDRYVRMRGAKKPNLSEIERAVMKTFLDHIEERLIVRLLHVVRQFEVTDKVIYFYVPEGNVQDFVVWLNSLPLSLWFEAYNRTVTVRSLKIS